MTVVVGMAWLSSLHTNSCLAPLPPPPFPPPSPPVGDIPMCGHKATAKLLQPVVTDEATLLQQSPACPLPHPHPSPPPVLGYPPMCGDRAAAKPLQPIVVDEATLLQRCCCCFNVQSGCALHLTQYDLKLIPCGATKKKKDSTWCCKQG